MPYPFRPHNEIWTFARQLRRDVDKLIRRGHTYKGSYEIKVFPDTKVVTTGDGKFIFAIPYDLNTLELRSAHAFVTTAGTGVTTVQIRNVTQAVDILTTRITIDSAEFTSMTAATAPVISAVNDDVAFADLIAIDVDTVGTGAKGLGVILVLA